jgi:hypothetical protein
VPRSASPQVGFRGASRFYSTELMYLTARSPWRWLADLVQPAGMARRRIERAVGDYLERLVSTNTARILNDLDERVLESRRLEAEIRGYLHAVCSSAERALERPAAGTRREGKRCRRRRIVWNRSGSESKRCPDSNNLLKWPGQKPGGNADGLAMSRAREHRATRRCPIDRSTVKFGNGVVSIPRRPTAQHVGVAKGDRHGRATGGFDGVGDGAV